jgi:4,5-dihydroxyphthalate decarboxylase
MSGRLRLTLATGDYDITRPLIDGAVEPAGLDLIRVTMPSPQRHYRMIMHHEFDIAELSLGSYVARLSRGEDDLIAVPAFPHRRFRHGYAFVSAKSGIDEPAQLAGRTVGLRSWQTTAGVWLRGILDEHHGLPVSAVRWVKQDVEDVELQLPADISLTQVDDDRTVTGMCARGEIDGLVYPELPRQVTENHGTILRLFPDAKAAEQDYFRDTGIFPIMHVVAMRRELAERYPWLPRTMLEAFEEAKRLAMRRLDNPRTVSLAWLRALQEEERALLGPDPWHYGYDEVNRNTLDTFLGYAVRQGVAAKRLGAADLFHPATLDRLPAYV